MEHLWNRLNAKKIINKGMLFATILLLCFFPFIIVANALAGQERGHGTDPASRPSTSRQPRT